VLGIGLFRNQRIYIFVFYFLTVSTFLVSFNYFIYSLDIKNTFVILLIFISLIILSGVFISKLAVDPLQEYITNLQNLSSETLHELNLPISTIKTNLQMLEKNILNPRNKKRLSRIKQASEMLQLRYDELDYMIKMQSYNKIEEYFFLDELLKQRVDFLQSIYPHISFKLDIESTKILNDKIGLSKVIDNIIDNGVKYSTDSKIIEIKLYNNLLSIKDFGCGMDEVELVQIFDTYYQNNKSMKGFGIGLGMVKRFCDANNIVLNILSKKDIGTTIMLNFRKSNG